MSDPLRIVVLEGDETGQELLEQAIRVLDPEVCGVAVELEHHDLSLERRRETENACVSDAAAAMREAGFGVKAATVTPEGTGRRRLPQPDPARGGRRQGDHPHRPAHPGRGRARVRRALPDLGRAHGGRRTPTARKQGREGAEGAVDEVALRTERITRDVCRAVAEFAFRSAARSGARVYGGPKWTVSPVYEGMLKEEMDAAAARHEDVDYRPVLIDATYAGLLSGAADAPLVIPALNRDGDCLSDLVMPMFGSIAGAESILLAFDDDFAVDVAMAEAPHGTAPSLQGKDVANPMAMILACAAVLGQAAARGYDGADRGLARDLRGDAGDHRRRRQDDRPRRQRGDGRSSPTR